MAADCALALAIYTLRSAWGGKDDSTLWSPCLDAHTWPITERAQSIGNVTRSVGQWRPPTPPPGAGGSANDGIALQRCQGYRGRRPLARRLEQSVNARTKVEPNTASPWRFGVPRSPWWWGTGIGQGILPPTLQYGTNVAAPWCMPLYGGKLCERCKILPQCPLAGARIPHLLPEDSVRGIGPPRWRAWLCAPSWHGCG